MLKKHAKWCRLSPNSPHSLSSQFLPHLETQRPFHRRVNFQYIMRQLSLLYNARLDPEQNKNEKTSLDYFVDDNLAHTLQSSVTYWVHSDNQVEMQLFLLKHLVLQLPSSPISSKEIHRSTRTAYLDSKDWRVYSSLLPEPQTSQTVNPKAPQILWEENSRNKNVLIVIPEGNDHKSLSLKRKNLSTFLSSNADEVDLTSAEWGSNTKDWIQTAEYVHNYIVSSSLHPGTLFHSNPVNNSHSSVHRPNQFCKSNPKLSNLKYKSSLRYIGQEHLLHPSPFPNRLYQSRRRRRPRQSGRIQERLPPRSPPNPLGRRLPSLARRIERESSH